MYIPNILIAVFGVILTGRQSGQKLQRLYGNPTANNLFPKSNFTKFVNRYVKILGGTFYSPSLKDVALAWLERRAQLIFVIFHTIVFKFGRVEGGAGKKLQTNVRKLEKLTEPLLSNLHSSNLVNA